MVATSPATTTRPVVSRVSTATRLCSTLSSLSRFHWEFLGEKELKHGKQAVLDRGSPSGGAEVYTFWINQDIIVPVADFVALLEDAIQTSPLNRRLHDGAHVEGRNEAKLRAQQEEPKRDHKQPLRPTDHAVPHHHLGAATPHAVPGLRGP